MSGERQLARMATGRIIDVGRLEAKIRRLEALLAERDAEIAKLKEVRDERGKQLIAFMLQVATLEDRIAKMGEALRPFSDALKLADVPPPPAGGSVSVPETIYKAVERVLDENSAWIARANKEVTERVALAAGIAWQAYAEAQGTYRPPSFPDETGGVPEERVDKTTDDLLHELKWVAAGNYRSMTVREDFARHLLSMISPAPLDGWRPDREAIARLISPPPFEPANLTAEWAVTWREAALAKADAILALPPPASGWRGIEVDKPPEKPGTYIDVRSTTTYRWLAYKPDGQRQMRRPGRWQRATEHGFENAELPFGQWRPNSSLPTPLSPSASRENIDE